MDIFLTTLKSLIPDLETSEDVDEDNVTKDENSSRDLSDVQITGENFDEIIDEDVQERKQNLRLVKLKTLRNISKCNYFNQNVPAW